MITSLPRRLSADEHGATLIEFALASLLFFMTVFGTIEFGRGVWQYNMMSDLAQEGARWAAVHGAANSSACSTSTQAACRASAAQIQSYVQSRSPGGFAVSVTTTPAPSSASIGSIIMVTVSSSFTPVVGIIPHSTLTLTGTAKMIVQR